jgi:hypothetical protein
MLVGKIGLPKLTCYFTPNIQGIKYWYLVPKYRLFPHTFTSEQLGITTSHQLTVTPRPNTIAHLVSPLPLYDDAANSPLRRRTSKTRHERLLIIRVIQECREYKQKWDVKHEI